MEWVDKMDTILKTLYCKSGEAPTMEKLEGWLPKKETGIDKGEIEDITLHLYREKYMYCCVDRNRNADYKDEGMFLISCAGKLFWENEGGFRKYFKRLADEKQANIEQVGRMEENEQRLSLWTVRLTWATVLAATLIVGWEMLKTFWIDHSEFASGHFALTNFLFGIVCGVLAISAIQLIRPKKSKPKPK